MIGRQWSIPELDASEAIIARHNVMAHAVAEINASVRTCTGDALNGAFKRAGRKAPSFGLSGIAPQAGAEAASEAKTDPYTGAPPPDYEDDRDTQRVVVDAFQEERILVIPDAHWPYVDETAWATMMRVGRFFRPQRIVVLGDFADFHAVSFHPKSAARRANLAEEVAASLRGFDDVDSLGAERKHFLHGNHEFRICRWIDSVGQPLHGLAGLTVPEMFSFAERGWTDSKYQKEHVVGDWRFCHDFGCAGPYALKRAIEVTDSNTIIGHTHRLAEHVGVARKDGRTIRGMSFGWLGSFEEIDYMHRAKANRDWTHACGVGWTRPDGTIRFEAVRFGGDVRVDGMRP